MLVDHSLSTEYSKRILLLQDWQILFAEFLDYLNIDDGFLGQR